MDNEFKVPTFDPKIKVPPKKSKVQPDEIVETKEIPATPSETVTKEVESAKVESNVAKVQPKCPYVEPKWSQSPESSIEYSFEVLKSGQIVENVKHLQSKAFWSIGKLPNNDIVMAHPTISRFHAILQYRPEIHNKTDSDSDDSDNEDSGSKSESTPQKSQIEKGWYLYDLSSTHGTFVNKMKVPPKTYVRLRVGYMIKFGASTRNYILQGPGFDEEVESELTITEMKELKLKKILEAKEKQLEEEKRKEEEGVSWGMSEDADEETDLSHNPFASTNNEELFLDDPKKTLRGYFEREGHNLEYKVDDVSSGTYVCRIELPITDSMGRSITAEFTHKGKKKECVAQCALEACRILDRNGVLRQANHEPRKRKVESSSDDDDEFYDRTAGAEEKRRRKAGTEESVTLSYEQLMEEEKKLETQLEDTEKKIERYQQLEKASKEKEAMEVDDLDDFMSGLSNEKRMDKAEVRKCRYELLRIKADIQKVKKLINIARPIELPPLKASVSGNTDGHDKKKLQLPLFGKKKNFGFDKLRQQVAMQKSTMEKKNNEAETIEEFDDDENDTKTRQIVETPAEEVINRDVEMKSCDVKTNESTPKPSEKCVEKEEIKTHVKENTPKPSEKRVEAEKQQKSVNENISAPEKSTDHDESVPKPKLPVVAEPNKQAESAVSSKNRNKNRHRNKARQQIDIDDTEEDTSPQKYSGWVPPSNQSGDGITDLNSKYGY